MSFPQMSSLNPYLNKDTTNSGYKKDTNFIWCIMGYYTGAIDCFFLFSTAWIQGSCDPHCEKKLNRRQINARGECYSQLLCRT